MACAGAYASAAEYAAFWCVGDLPLSDDETAMIDTYLGIAASDVHASLAAAGMCDCTLADWATPYLKKLNLIDAAIFHRCPCGRPELTDAQKTAYLFWINEQLTLIRESKMDLCAGETGASFPAQAWGRQGLTAWATAELFINNLMREG